jgi:MraZ protein
MPRLPTKWYKVVYSVRKQEGGAVTLFVGNYRHSIDVKGRLVLPSRFRSSFEGEAFVAPYELNGLAIWTVEDYERDLAQRQARLHESPEYDTRFRAVNAFTEHIEIDKQGRFLLQPSLRERFNLTDEVVFAGNGDHVELWNPAAFDAAVQANLDVFTQTIA